MFFVLMDEKDLNVCVEQTVTAQRRKKKKKEKGKSLQEKKTLFSKGNRRKRHVLYGRQERAARRHNHHAADQSCIKHGPCVAMHTKRGSDHWQARNLRPREMSSGRCVGGWRRHSHCDACMQTQ
jgi:hypothetical protein